MPFPPIANPSIIMPIAIIILLVDNNNNMPIKYQIPNSIDVILVPIFWSTIPQIIEPIIPIIAAIVTTFIAPCML